jgi:hypothetical protein
MQLILQHFCLNAHSAISVQIVWKFICCCCLFEGSLWTKMVHDAMYAYFLLSSVLVLISFRTQFPLHVYPGMQEQGEGMRTCFDKYPSMLTYLKKTKTGGIIYHTRDLSIACHFLLPALGWHADSSCRVYFVVCSWNSTCNRNSFDLKLYHWINKYRTVRYRTVSFWKVQFIINESALRLPILDSKCAPYITILYAPIR